MFSAERFLTTLGRGVAALAAVALLAPSDGSAGGVPANSIYALPTLEPVPASVAGMASFVVSLNGTWKINHNPPPEFWNGDVSPSDWDDVTVPARLGPPGPRATLPYGYKKLFSVPADFAGKRAILRFEGVSCEARAWVNGRFVRDHWGTFMAWSCDVTDFVTPGTDAWLSVLVDDRANGLAEFVRPGGIMRDVRLFAVPSDHLTRLQVETTLDSQQRDALLHVRLKMAFARAENASVELRMKGADGARVPLEPSTVSLSAMDPESIVAIPVANPRKWDGEHPNLYVLEAAVRDSKGEIVETLSRNVGFREVRVEGNRMLVNGREVKLRGIWGGFDAAGLKEINVNHTRQKYASEAFLDDADRLGLYVLDEVPVDFAKYGVEADPKYAGKWLSLIAELMERDRNHPSVVIWGLGNESFSGPNVLSTFHFVQAEDHQRPAMFSWSNRVKTDEELPYSIYSVHYPNLNDPNLNLGGYSVAVWHSPSLVRDRMPPAVMPVLQDEYAHVILNEALILRDPNVRNFWGESIFRFWEKMFVTPGALGGDQFGMGLRLGRGNLPNGPEYYLLREAYSPVRVENRPLANPGPEQPLRIGVGNWYDHTDLSELKVDWAVGSDHGEAAGPTLAPHEKGLLMLPGRQWRDGDVVTLKFIEPSGHLANEFRLRVNPPRAANPSPVGPGPRLEETPAEIVITGRDFRVVFDRYLGLMKEASVGGENTVVAGPFLNLLGSGLAYGEWWCDRLTAHQEGSEVVVDIRGNYAVIAATFQVRVDGSGLITTKYTVDHVPGMPPAPTFSPWNATSVGGYSEVGVSYVLPPSVNRLSWNRKALWSVYPDDHTGRPVGTAKREASADPGAPWGSLEDPPGTGSNDWRAMKENVYSAAAWSAGAGAALTALSDGSVSVRLAVDPGYRALKPGVRMLIDTDWNYEDFGLGNYARPPLLVRDGYSGTVYMRLGKSP